MSIEMMFVTEAHYTLTAFEAFDITVGYHVSFKVRVTFECFTAALLLAYVGSGIRMSFFHVAIEMTYFFEDFLALLALVLLQLS